MPRFLIDENLSPRLCEVGHAHGYDTTHVNYRNWSGLHDPPLFRRVVEENLVIVTNNREDFEQLIAGADLHPGLVVIMENVRRERQVYYFELALARIGAMPDLVNQVVKVYEDGTVTVEEIPRIA